MKKILATTLACLTLGTGFAATTNTSTTSTKTSLFDTIVKNSGLNYFGVINGPSMGNIVNDRRTDENGTSNGDHLSMDHQVGYQYKMNDTATFVWNFRFNTGLNPENHSFNKDDRVGFQGTWYKNDYHSFWARFDLEVPFSTVSKNGNRKSSPGWLSVNTFTVNSLTAVGLMTYGRYRIIDSSDDTIILGAYPFATYKFADKADVTVYWNDEYVSGTGKLADLERDAAWLNVGVNYNISDSWTIYPSVVIPTDDKSNDIDNSKLEIWVMGSFF